MTRVYVPLALTGLRALHATGELQAGDAYAVTPALRDTYAGTGTTDDEDLEYVAMTIAARASLTRLDPSDPADRRRVVVALDADVEHGGDHPALVRLTGPVPRSRLASVHVDTPDVREAVDAAVRALPAAADGDPAAVAVVEELDGEDLAWYAVQELPDLLDG